MSELEIIYETASGKIIATKIAGVEDTVVPEGCLKKRMPFVAGMLKDIDEKLFDGVELIFNPGYVKPKSNSEKIQQANTFEELKAVLVDML